MQQRLICFFHLNVFIRLANFFLPCRHLSIFQFGKVDSAVVVRDPHSRECRGFGFVKMLTDKDAQQAIDGLREYEFEGRHISVERAKRNGPHTRTPGAYLGMDRRIRDRYAGMKRSRDYYAYGAQYPPPPPPPPQPYPAAYRAQRFYEPGRPRYDHRAVAPPVAPHEYHRAQVNPRYDQRMPAADERERTRRRFDSDAPRYSPREAARDQRVDGREPPVPRESADDVI